MPPALLAELHRAGRLAQFLADLAVTAHLAVLAYLVPGSPAERALATLTGENHP